MGLKVLLVDDDPGFRERAAAFLTRLPGVDLAEAAASGEEGLLRIQSVRPDLVLLDLRMPGLGGFDVLRLTQDRAAPRIVVVSLYDDEERRGHALSLGAAGFVSKPDFASALPALLRELFPEWLG